MTDYTYRVAELTAKFEGILETPVPRPLSEQRLQSVEVELGCELPQDYRDFLRTYADIFLATTVLIPNGKGSELAPIAYNINCLYGIDTENPHMDVLYNFRNLQAITPSNLLRIGTSDEGFPAMSLTADSKGSIYFVVWPNDEVNWNEIHLLTSSFKQFCEMLEPRSRIN